MRLLISSLILLVPFAAQAGKITDRSCEPCLDDNGRIIPMWPWQTISGEYDGEQPEAYRFITLAGEEYIFSFCQEGGTADFDTALSIQGPNGCGEILECNDDTCGPLSEIVWIAPEHQEYYISIDGPEGASGSYVLAYTGVEWYTLAAARNWSTVKSAY